MEINNKELAEEFEDKINQLHFEIIFQDVIKARNKNGESIYRTNSLEYEKFKKDPYNYCLSITKEEKEDVFLEMHLFKARLLHSFKIEYRMLLKLKY